MKLCTDGKDKRTSHGDALPGWFLGRNRSKALIKASLASFVNKRPFLTTLSAAFSPSFTTVPEVSTSETSSRYKVIKCLSITSQFNPSSPGADWREGGDWMNGEPSRSCGEQSRLETYNYRGTLLMFVLHQNEAKIIGLGECFTPGSGSVGVSWCARNDPIVNPSKSFVRRGLSGADANKHTTRTCLDSR